MGEFPRSYGVSRSACREKSTGLEVVGRGGGEKLPMARRASDDLHAGTSSLSSTDPGPPGGVVVELNDHEPAGLLSRKWIMPW
jgi:hypothetical protein